MHTEQAPGVRGRLRLAERTREPRGDARDTRPNADSSDRKLMHCKGFTGFSFWVEENGEPSLQRRCESSTLLLVRCS
jgi:hypothetical protein